MLERPSCTWPLCLAALLAAGCSEDELFVPQDAGPLGSAGSPPTSGGIDAGGAAGEGGESSVGSGGTPAVEVPEPLLSGLFVDGVRVGLKPAFDPQRHRYSVLAAPLPEPTEIEPEPDPAVLSITASADPELSISIDGEPALSGVGLPLPDALPGGDIEILVENSEGDENTYLVRYLPPDFPDINITISEPGASRDPIYVAMRLRDVYYLAKLDPKGVPLFYQKRPRAIFDFKKQPGGVMSFSERTGVDVDAENIILDENFEEIDRVSTVGLTNTNEHEFRILPNGNFIVLAYEFVHHDLTDFGLSSNASVVDAHVQELSPDREILFEWNSWDHMIYGESQYLERNSQDYSHINSVDVLPDGNWLLSSRGMSQLLKIDRKTGEVIWKLGGVQNEFTFIDDPYGGLCGQHTAYWVGNGHVLLFDNGQYCWPKVEERGELTRVVEYEIDEDAKTARLVWSFSRDGAYTYTQGSAQRLDNGNTFVGWGGGPRQMATEVDPDGNIVFEFEALGIDGVFFNYRAYRFAD